MPSKDELVEMLGSTTRREPFVQRNIRGEIVAVTEDYYLWFRCGCHAYQSASEAEYTLRPCFRRDCPRRHKTMA